MTKYYRVKNQQEWDWLMQWFEKQSKHIKWGNGEKPTVFRPMFNWSGKEKEKAIYLNGNQLMWDLDSECSLFEVSDLMEDEKMGDYVTISGEKLLQVKDEDGGYVFDSINGVIYGSELPIKKMRILKSSLYPKVRMSVAEKAEFDKYYQDMSLIDTLYEIKLQQGSLSKRIYEHTSSSVKEFEFEFARAWADPSLIEVIPEKKYWVKVPKTKDRYYYKEYNGELKCATQGNEPCQHFTAEEIKEHGLDNDIFEKVEVEE